jgi:coenzyme PQQ synthesis protein D (PqqD)
MTGTLRRRSDLTIRDLGSEMILYDASSETYHVLNATARQIWLWLDEDGLGQKMMGLFPQEDPARIEADLARTIEEFGRVGLVER